MRITYDSEADVLCIRFIETTVTTKHVAEGIAVDYDTDGKIAALKSSMLQSVLGLRMYSKR